MRILLFALFIPLLSFAQTSSNDNEPQVNSNEIEPVRLVRAVDDRKQLIRQRRDLLDVASDSSPTEVQVEK
ncbi:MAG: hypothetical protein COW79_17270 [Bdellovibrionales bacterium CG22_combo_CG10-13_8_21_14_all_38_13]|nr:MAG: hypothetical protein COW79_17270 [Bdellovibrionales bacterium CG22_combo_CG10-13_8_21_14_all_38_13]